MGRKNDTFDLIPYQEDSFYWGLTYDETAKLARDPSLPAEFHVLKFGSEKTHSSGITCSWWKHEPGLSEPGEMFTKVEEDLHEDMDEL